ncbi:MAG: hypothetical protein ACLQF1_17425 [Methyloceanibacter sp.]
MKKLSPWVKLPSAWIESRRLKQFRWVAGEGSDALAGLMALTVITHHADQATGVARLSYTQLSEMASLSRAKLAAGLDVLEARGLVERSAAGRGSYALAEYNPRQGWAKFPAAGLYLNGVVALFDGFHLRQRAELDSLKLLFLIAARRDRQSNLARMTYDKIEDYSGISREQIRRGLTVLGVAGIVHVDRIRSNLGEDRVANAYRLAHIDSYRHAGTIGRAGAADLEFVEPDVPGPLS